MLLISINHFHARARDLVRSSRCIRARSSEQAFSASPRTSLHLISASIKSQRLALSHVKLHPRLPLLHQPLCGPSPKHLYSLHSSILLKRITMDSSTSRAEQLALNFHGTPDPTSTSPNLDTHRIKLVEYWGIQKGDRVLEIGCGQVGFSGVHFRVETRES